MASALPTPDTLAKAAALTVFDAEGKRVSFASIIRDQKTIVVFIRRLYPCDLGAYWIAYPLPHSLHRPFLLWGMCFSPFDCLRPVMNHVLPIPIELPSKQSLLL